MRDIAAFPSEGDADIAALASLFADPARCSVLLALDDGRALPASVLADEARVSRSTASSHLSKLTDAGLLRVETHGRHRYYRLAGPQVGALLEQLVALAPPRPIRSLREGTRAAKLRSARTCYDHLAGRLGVELMRSLLDRAVLTGGDGLSNPGLDVRYELTDHGRGYLTKLGVEIPVGRRPLVRYCVDWSEQRHHLGGALGRAMLDRFLAARWISRVPRGRALTVTAEGRTALADWFGVDWPDLVETQRGRWKNSR
jgi:DNA-binding transcriptional ArsR family regulator